MRVAVCISGAMRGYKESAYCLVPHLISKFYPDVDVFVSTWRDRGKREQSHYMFPLGNHADDESITENDIISLYPNVRMISIEEFLPEYCNEIAGVVKPTELVAQAENKVGKYTIPMYYQMKKCNDIRKDFQEKYNVKYDAVIRTRPDILAGPVSDGVLNSLDFIWAYPDGLGYRVSDRLAISTPENMDYYSNCFDSLNKYWEEGLQVDGRWKVGEIMMKTHLDAGKFEYRTMNKR